jgi:hypothetical protein
MSSLALVNRRERGVADDGLEAAMQIAIETGRMAEHADLCRIPALTPCDILRDQGWADKWDRGRRVRDWFIDRYSFAVPSRQAVEAIAKHGDALEVGAGTGLWSRILSHRVDVIATDVTSGENPYGQPVATWHPVAEMEAAAAVNAHPSRTVLMVWPCYDDSWAHDTAKAMRSGTVLCYIGEGYGGCTGCDQFHRYIEESFEQLAEVTLPQFDGLHDYLQIFRKA